MPCGDKSLAAVVVAGLSGVVQRGPVATSNGGTERRAALPVSAHQCGSLITAESFRR
jgi:hypothetical protein